MSNAEVLLLLIGAANLTAFLYAYPKAMDRRAARLRLRRRTAPAVPVVAPPVSARDLVLTSPPAAVRVVIVTEVPSSSRLGSPRAAQGLSLDPEMLTPFGPPLS